MHTRVDKINDDIPVNSFKTVILKFERECSDHSTFFLFLLHYHIKYYLDMTV